MKSGTIKRVTLAEVPEAQKSTIANLIQLYKYDFSEFAEVDSPYGEVSADGRFTYDGLDSYWQEEGRSAFTLHADSRLAGFALVNRWSALDRPLDRAVGEFFVLRKYRRYRVGSRAATLLFERFRGRWEVASLGTIRRPCPSGTRSSRRSPTDPSRNARAQRCWMAGDGPAQCCVLSRVRDFQSARAALPVPSD
jgi:predicted acetyltransferase